MTMGVENKIPEGWKEVPLKEILLKSNQGVNTTTEKVIYSTKGHGVVKAQDILERKINFSVSDYVDKHEYARLSTHVKPKLNDILYSNIGSKMGNAAKVKSDFQFIIAWNVLRLQINTEKADVDFLVQLLNSKTIRRAICSLNSSSTMPFVSGGVIRLFEINLPPLQEQKAIANILTAFDDKIELLQAQNKTLETMAQTIFKEWFGKYQIGDELPEGWRVGKLGEIASLKSGFAFKSKDFVEEGNMKALKIKDLKGDGRVSLHQLSSVSKDVTASSRVQYFKLEQGDIVIAMSGNTTGKIGVIPPHSEEVYLNQRVGKFFMIKEELNSFLYAFLMSGNYEEKILSMGYGSAQPNISPSQIESIDMIYPNEVKLLSFLNISKPIFGKVLYNNDQIQSLTKTRDTLLPKLMSGQIRVKNIKQTADA